MPVQKWMQKIHPPEPNFTYHQAICLIPVLQAGDILISKNHMRLTNLFIPGSWSHAAIYDGMIIYEAVGTGVQKVHPIEWFLKCNDFAVLRPNSKLSERARHEMVAWLRSIEGRPYDYSFDFSTTQQAFYCSELAYLAWANVSKWNDWTNSFRLRKTFGEVTVVADDFYNAVKKGKLTLIYEHYQKGKK